MGEVDVYAKLRELRRKILAFIKNLPDIAFANITPESIEIKQFLGRSRLGVGTYNANIYLADKNNNKIDGVEVSLNAPAKILTEEDVARVLSEMLTRPLRVKVQYGTEELYVTIEHYAITKVYAYDVQNVVYSAFPLDYQPDTPLRCEFHGSTWRYIDRDRNYEIIIVIGQVGYYSAGNLIQWTGTAVLLLIGDIGVNVKVITPRGMIAGKSGEKVIVVFSPVWALYAKKGVIAIEEPT